MAKSTIVLKGVKTLPGPVRRAMDGGGGSEARLTTQALIKHSGRPAGRQLTEADSTNKAASVLALRRLHHHSSVQPVCHLHCTKISASLSFH